MRCSPKVKETKKKKWQDIASLYRKLVIFSYTYRLSDKFPITPSWMLETKRLFAVKRSGSLQWASPREYSCCRKTSFVERSRGRHLQTRILFRIARWEDVPKSKSQCSRSIWVWGKTHKHYFIGKFNLQSTAIFRDAFPTSHWTALPFRSLFSQNGILSNLQDNTMRKINVV